MVEADVLELGVHRGLDHRQRVHHVVDDDGREGAQEALEEGPHHEVGRSELQREKYGSNWCSEGGGGTATDGSREHLQSNLIVICDVLEVVDSARELMSHDA